GDFNGDGFLDLIVTDSLNNTVNFLAGNGIGAFVLKSSVAQFTTPAVVAMGDFNHDGHADFAVSCSLSGTVAIFIGNGNGTFQPAVNYTMAPGPSTVELADVDGASNLDLLVPDLNGVEISLGNGDGTFQAPYSYAAPFGSGLAVSDFNGDGKSDLVLTTTAGVSFVVGKGA